MDHFANKSPLELLLPLRLNPAKPCKLAVCSRSLRRSTVYHCPQLSQLDQLTQASQPCRTLAAKKLGIYFLSHTD